MACNCEECGRIIKMDTVVDHDLWAKISPTNDEGGLLCAACIVDRIADITEGDRKWASARLISGHL